jgi:hypothetical protein
VRPERRLVVGLVLGMFLLASCGDGDGPRAGVGVRSISTNVGLGVELQAAAPANTVVRLPQQRGPQEPSSTLPPFDFELPKPSNRPCPAAGPFDFPDIETGVEPEGRPVEGKLPWKLDGTVTTGAGVLTVDTFDERTIRNVEDHPSIPDAFTFEVVQENLIDERQNRGALTTRFRVVPLPAVRQEQVPNDAGKGLFIEAITFEGEDSEGNTVETTTSPVPAVQLIAFPVKDGAVIDSTGTDPATFARLTFRGEVKGKKQVDACGDRVDSWFVDAELVYQYPTGNGQTETIESNYDYGVAPQYGAMLVFEHVEAPKEGPVIRIDARVGRVPSASGG